MSNTITIPFCYLANSLSQTFDMDTCKRSLFQINHLRSISERDDFAYFILCGVTDPDIVDPDYKSWFMCSWYDKTGSMHSIRLGMKKILNDGHERIIPSHIAALDSPVYKSRIQ